MSTYTTAEAALLTLVRAYNSGATFTAKNCTRGNFAVLDAKGTDVACVLMQARASEMADNLGGGRGSHGKRQQRHTVGVTLFAKRKQGLGGDGAAYQALTALADGVCAWLDTYPRLNNAASVKRAEVVELGDARFREARPWLWQTLMVEVITETAPVLVEGAQ